MKKKKKTTLRNEKNTLFKYNIFILNKRKHQGYHRATQEAEVKIN